MELLDPDGLEYVMQNLEDAEASVAVSNPLHKWALKHHHGPVLWKWTVPPTDSTHFKIHCTSKACDLLNGKRCNFLQGYFEFYHEAFKRWIGRSPTFLLLGVSLHKPAHVASTLLMLDSPLLTWTGQYWGGSFHVSRIFWARG